MNETRAEEFPYLFATQRIDKLNKTLLIIAIECPSANMLAIRTLLTPRIIFPCNNTIYQIVAVTIDTSSTDNSYNSNTHLYALRCDAVGKSCQAISTVSLIPTICLSPMIYSSRLIWASICHTDFNVGLFASSPFFSMSANLP